MNQNDTLTFTEENAFPAILEMLISIQVSVDILVDKNLQNEAESLGISFEEAVDRHNAWVSEERLRYLKKLYAEYGKKPNLDDLLGKQNDDN